MRSTAIALGTLVRSGADRGARAAHGALADAGRARTAAGATRRRTRGRWRRSSTTTARYESDVPDFTAVVALGRETLSRDAVPGPLDRRAGRRSSRWRSSRRRRSPASGAARRSRARAPGTLLLRRALHVRADRSRPDGARPGLRASSARTRRRRTSTAPGTTFKAGELVKVTLRFRVPKERRYVAVDRSAARRHRAGGERGSPPPRSARRARTRDEQGSTRLDRLVAARRLRPRRAPRRPRAALRHAPGRGRARVLVPRARDHRRHVPGAAPRGRRRCTSPRSSAARRARSSKSGREDGVAPADGARVRGRCWRRAAAWLRLGPVAARPARTRAARVDRGRRPPRRVALRGAVGGRHAQPAADARTTCRRTLVAATLAAEDRRFFGHPGVDPLAVARASWHNVRARPRGRGRLHDHPAGGEAAASRGRAPRAASCARPCSRCASSIAHQARDPRALPERRALRKPASWAPRRPAAPTSAARRASSRPPRPRSWPACRSGRARSTPTRPRRVPARSSRCST